MRRCSATPCCSWLSGCARPGRYGGWWKAQRWRGTAYSASPPNPFAGTTLTLWQAFGTRTGPVASAGFAVAVLGLMEAVQLVLPRHRANVWDVVASVVGAAAAAVIIQSRRSRVR